MPCRPFAPIFRCHGLLAARASGTPAPCRCGPCRMHARALRPPATPSTVRPAPAHACGHACSTTLTWSPHACALTPLPPHAPALAPEPLPGAQPQHHTASESAPPAAHGLEASPLLPAPRQQPLRVPPPQPGGRSVPPAAPPGLRRPPACPQTLVHDPPACSCSAPSCPSCVFVHCPTACPAAARAPLTPPSPARTQASAREPIPPAPHPAWGRPTLLPACSPTEPLACATFARCYSRCRMRGRGRACAACEAPAGAAGRSPPPCAGGLGINEARALRARCHACGPKEGAAEVWRTGGSQ